MPSFQTARLGHFFKRKRPNLCQKNLHILPQRKRCPLDLRVRSSLTLLFSSLFQTYIGSINTVIGSHRAVCSVDYLQNWICYSTYCWMC
ncbi:hypothetical protein DPEC_G00247080 [Dallia pectoralis]|uniref:Uncharacterized protein n=1 Tax=Dallia pectoralis TaxID=75939 RepID=A0ACC2FW70_DALPE|nr:hypothetical protein DPEC_G00247080 [Dallia pectoralis]